MEQRVTELWYREAPGGSWLLPLAWCYGCVIRLRRWFYECGLFKVRRVGKPVIIVGNLTVGGTGKTPLVAWLAEQLAGSGLKVGIVSRGYGGANRVPQVVHADSDWRDVGDEPLLLRRLTGCDTVVGQDRVAAAQELIARGIDLIVADDGLQHLRLGRQCEIVVIDGARGFGNGRLLPAGPLREPVSRLSRAALVVVNGPAEHSSLSAGSSPLATAALNMTLIGETAHRLDEAAGAQKLEHFRGRPVHAVAGIGNPARFFRDLRARGLEVIEHAFADHHPFVAAELTFGDELPVLMTEKDAVRCRSFATAQQWYVPVVACFSDAQARELLDRVTRALGPLLRRTSAAQAGDES